MRYVPALILCAPLLALPGVTHAGPMYGSVRLGPAPAAGAQVEVACPSFGQPQVTASAGTDPGGGFSLLIHSTGRCEMRVSRGGQQGAPFEVFVSDSPLKFDVELDGALTRVR